MDIWFELNIAKEIITKIVKDKDKLLKPFVVLCIVIIPAISVIILKYHALINIVIISSILYWIVVYLLYRRSIKPKNVILNAEYMDVKK